MFGSISQLHLHKSAPNFQNGLIFCDDQKEGYNPILMSELYMFSSFLDSI